MSRARQSPPPPRRLKKKLPPLDQSGRKKVFEAIEAAGPGGITHSRLRRVVEGHSISSLDARLTELVDAGLVERCRVARGSKMFDGFRPVAEETA